MNVRSGKLLESKAALVTGASSGMGREIAKAFAGAGAQVVAVARSEERLKSVVDEIIESGGTAVAMVRDLTEPGAPQDVVARAAEMTGRLDILASVAGVMELAPFSEATIESLDRQYVTNVQVPFALTQASLPHLTKSQGTVIFISSLAALAAFPDSAAYTASKGAIDAFARQIAVELAPSGVRVNAIAPGEIDTPMNAEFYSSHPEWLKWITEFTPARRVGDPAEVADVAVFLASDLARFVYGVSIPVDGGLVAR